MPNLVYILHFEKGSEKLLDEVRDGTVSNRFLVLLQMINENNEYTCTSPLF